MPSFDIVSEYDKHEASNAIDQANREIQGRFDFKGVTASFEQNGDTVLLEADVDFQLKQMLDVLGNRLIARGIDVRCMEAQERSEERSVGKEGSCRWGRQQEKRQSS